MQIQGIIKINNGIRIERVTILTPNNQVETTKKGAPKLNINLSIDFCPTTNNKPKNNNGSPTINKKRGFTTQSRKIKNQKL